MNLLFIYRRNIHQEDSGASRTIILRENFLAAQSDVLVFSSFHHLSPVDKRIRELNITPLSSRALHEAILQHKIDILCVPEGEFLTEMASDAVRGTNCKIVSELHSKPNHYVETLYSSIIGTLYYSHEIKARIKALIKLLLFPILRIRRNHISMKANRKAYELADKFVVLSSNYISPFASIFKVDRKKLVSIGNPLSFNKTLEINQLNQKTNSILVVSRFDESAKRISLIIKVWSLLEKKHPDWHLQIVGNGDSEQLYKQLVECLKLKNVVFYGWQSPEPFYEKASIYLMTSIIEGWPMTLIESLQKGCVPVVMDTFASLREIITDNCNGIIVPNNDLNRMSIVVDELISNAVYRRQLAENAILSSTRFNINVIGNKWLDLYKSLL